MNLPTVCRKCTRAPSKVTKLILECSFFADEGLVLKNRGLEMPASKFAQLIGDLKRWTPVFRGYTPLCPLFPRGDGMGERTSGQTSSFGERSRRWYVISLPQNLKGSWTVPGNAGCASPSIKDELFSLHSPVFIALCFDLRAETFWQRYEGEPRENKTHWDIRPLTQIAWFPSSSFPSANIASAKRRMGTR